MAVTENQGSAGSYSSLLAALHQALTGKPTPPAPAPTNAPAPAAPQPVQSPTMTRDSFVRAGGSYTVVSGDSLSAIAQKTLGNGNRWKEIYDLNRDQLSDPDRIYPGQVLKLPGGAPAPAPAPTPAPAPAPKPAAATYQVQPGDTLTAIAQRTLGAASRWSDIFNLNRDQLSNPDQIQVGQVLKLPDGASAPAPAPSSSPAVGGTVGEWIAQAMSIMEANGTSASKMDAGDINTIIQHESSGDPKAVNNWDSNAAAGHPSKGLMQTIDSTFSAYALPGHGNIFNPVDNIIAGVRYAISRYGSIQNVPGIVNMAHGGAYVGY